MQQYYWKSTDMDQHAEVIDTLLSAAATGRAALNNSDISLDDCLEYIESRLQRLGLPLQSSAALP